MFQHNLDVLNKGYNPTFANLRGFRTIIDITLALGSSDDVHNWHVCEEYTFSDHRMIEFSVDFMAIQGPKVKKINWEHFARVFNVSETRYRLWNEEAIEKESADLVSAIKSALYRSTSLVNLKKQSANWMTNDLRKEKMEVIKLERAWWRNKTAESRDIFIEAQKEYRKKNF